AFIPNPSNGVPASQENPYPCPSCFTFSLPLYSLPSGFFPVMSYSPSRSVPLVLVACSDSIELTPQYPTLPSSEPSEAILYRTTPQPLPLPPSVYETAISLSVMTPTPSYELPPEVHEN